MKDFSASWRNICYSQRDSFCVTKCAFMAIFMQWDGDFWVTSIHRLSVDFTVRSGLHNCQLRFSSRETRISAPHRLAFLPTMILCIFQFPLGKTGILVQIQLQVLKHLCQSANFRISTQSIKTKRNQFPYFRSERCKTWSSTAKITMSALTRQMTHLLLSLRALIYVWQRSN